MLKVNIKESESLSPHNLCDLPEYDKISYYLFIKALNYIIFIL